MSSIQFDKYQGTGNDFVMVDNRTLLFDKNNTSLVASICHRNFGVGADGLILIEHCDDADYRMVYYNSDGHESSMCGNGGRCSYAFAKALGIVGNTATFLAIDGLHHVKQVGDSVALQMVDAELPMPSHDGHFVDTGSPHHVTLIDDLDALNLVPMGRTLRNRYGEAGSNVNFVELTGDNNAKVRTYERGVENETLSCGTGATAVALYLSRDLKPGESNQVGIKQPGGTLQISVTRSNSSTAGDPAFTDVWLQGPAQFVFSGTFPC